jgi:hypothetical protein
MVDKRNDKMYWDQRRHNSMTPDWLKNYRFRLRCFAPARYHNEGHDPLPYTVIVWTYHFGEWVYFRKMPFRIPDHGFQKMFLGKMLLGYWGYLLICIT